ncbi:MAG: hypothetical protein NT004_17385 [Bacteroidetes bacterium]|nr:hypothetical protein [Bacteroidota bacterium]
MPKKKKARKKARKPVKFKTITIKVTAHQKKSLMNYCKSHRTTPTKMIKKSIHPFLDKYADMKVVARKREVVKQLELF